MGAEVGETSFARQSAESIGKEMYQAVQNKMKYSTHYTALLVYILYHEVTYKSKV